MRNLDKLRTLSREELASLYAAWPAERALQNRLIPVAPRRHLNCKPGLTHPGALPYLSCVNVYVTGCSRVNVLRNMSVRANPSMSRPIGSPM